MWTEPIWLAAEAGDGAEPGRTALEALAQAQALTRGLGGGVRVLLLAAAAVPPEQAAAWRRLGAAAVAVLRGPDLAGPDSRARVDAVAAALARGRPQVLLAADSEHAAAWTARLAARLGLPVAAGCVEVTAAPGVLRMRREALRGAVGVTAEYRLDPDRLPAVVLLAPGAWAAPAGAAAGPGPAPPDGAGAGPPPLAVLELPPSAAVGAPVRLRRGAASPGAPDLGEADLILAGGAGLGSAAAFDRLRAVARRLGAAVGASRLAVDRGWARPEEQVGLTGRQVAPRVYVAFGISGAREHMAGLADAQHIVAVNTDRSAPLATASRLLAPADAAAVLDALDAAADRRLVPRPGPAATPAGPGEPGQGGAL